MRKILLAVAAVLLLAGGAGVYAAYIATPAYACSTP